jgi:hypothetical protein
MVVKILEKQAGTLSRTAVASLGGLITSESTGYTGTNCDIELKTTSDHYWEMTGTSGTAMSLNYTTSAACVEDDIIYLQAYMTADKGYNAPLEGFSIEVAGTTGGSGVVASYAQSEDEEAGICGNYALTSAFTGNLVLKFKLTDTSGVAGIKVQVALWTAINLTDQFGEEIDNDYLREFFDWRCNENAPEPTWTQRNWRLYNPTGTGDHLYYASKIVDHGLEYNDLVCIDPSGETAQEGWSNVYVLNDDWIITAGDKSYCGTVACDVDFWTKTNYTDKVMAKSLQVNMRNDIDGSARMTFLGTSEWQPKLGMTVMIMENDEEAWPETFLFTGHISKISTTRKNDTNWFCDCEVSSLLTTLQTQAYQTGAVETTATTTGEAIRDVIQKANAFYDSSVGGLCFWWGSIDAGNIDIEYSTQNGFTSLYSMLDSLCKAAGLVLLVYGDRKLYAIEQTTTPPDAPRNLTDADGIPAWDIVYSEDMSTYGSSVFMYGGYEADGHPCMGLYNGAPAISSDYFAGNPSQSLSVSNSNINNQTDATAAATAYYYRHGKVVPGELSFVTEDLDYRPGQKISIDIDALGMTSAKTMLIDSVLIFDADGKNLQSKVTCSNRDGTTFATAANPGTNSFMSDLSAKVSASVSAVEQQASTFVPYLYGDTVEGTWEYSTQDGNYVRLGNMVYIVVRVVPSSIDDSPSGDLLLGGLPFASAITPARQMLTVLSDDLYWGSSMTQISLSIHSNVTEGIFYGSANNAGWVAVDAANIVADDDIRVSGWYQIA